MLELKKTWIMAIIIFAWIHITTTVYADIEVHYLDVGQGDACIVLCDGESMVIDGGPILASSYIYSYVRDTLNLKHIDYVVSTHPHEDHLGGLASVLNAAPVDLILSPVLDWDTDAWAAFARYASLQGCPIVIPYDGDTLSLGNAKVTILYCWPEAWETNDMSICLRIDYGDNSFLFTGDAEYMAEYAMISNDLPLKADVLKIAHHGSRSSSIGYHRSAGSY